MNNNNSFIGTIERITYYNAQNGYGVIKVTPEDAMPLYTAKDGTITVVGVMPELGIGERAEFKGRWHDDPRYGRQMQLDALSALPPNNEAGIARYLSGIVKGIGPVTAEKIVKHFGVKTVEILNREPHRLEEVPGLKTSLAGKLAEAWAENYDERQAIIYLQGYGISLRMARRIHKHYQNSYQNTIEVVKKNPYSLAEDVFGIGFLKADQIAQNMGIPKDSPLRIQAGLVYTLSHLSLEGHCFAPRDVLVETAIRLLNVDDQILIETTLESQITQGKLVQSPLVFKQHMIDAIYLPYYYFSESDAASFLRNLADTPSKITQRAAEINWPHFLANLAEQNEISLTQQQQSAVEAAFSSKFSVLTGGPGTGKTTTLQMVIAALAKESFSYALASPTGRAAKRLSEATDCEAFTIHRLLNYMPLEGEFWHNEDEPLNVDVVIVDEASMIDIGLFCVLLRALQPQTHLMLVGDVDQLPSVGAGNVLRDVIDSRIGHVTRLESIFRQSENSHIILNAHRVNMGQAPFMDNKSQDFFFFREEDPVQAAELVVDIVKNRLPDKFGIHPMDDVQVIAPMYRGQIGIDRLNEMLQATLNGDERMAELTFNHRIYRVGDKVMQTRNNYAKDIFNGDIGRINAIDKHENRLTVLIDGRLVDYELSELHELIHAYCISTHRSQGSEYPVVVLPIMTQFYMMLQRNLLYTAITRARRMVVMVGSPQAVHMAVKNNKVAERYSGLLSRLV